MRHEVNEQVELIKDGCISGMVQHVECDQGSTSAAVAQVQNLQHVQA